MIDRGARRCGHVAVDSDHSASICPINKHRRFAANRVHVRIHDALNQGGGDGSVDRVAACCENAGAGRGREIMLSCDHGLAAHHQRIPGRHVRYPSCRRKWQAKQPSPAIIPIRVVIVCNRVANVKRDSTGALCLSPGNFARRRKASRRR